MPDPRLDSAIPAHLRRSRTCPVHQPAGFAPPYPSYSARFAPELGQMVMAVLGVQYRGARPPSVIAAVETLDSLVSGPDGPGHIDRATRTDPEGHIEEIVIAYWSEPRVHDRWMCAGGDDWVRLERSSDAGFFLEVIRPPSDRFETLFSSTARRDGVAHLALGLSDEIADHGYWGGMRDRIPAAQTDQLESSSVDLRVHEVDGVRHVAGLDNLCLIRSGQDWTDTDAGERAMYLEDVEPSLRAGMDFLAGRGGREVGCLTNRYMTVLDESGGPTEKTFGLSMWRGLDDLERWARSHPTHQRIFAAALSHLGRLGPDARLRLNHEVAVVAAADQRFEYRNCHPRSGLLAGVGGGILARSVE